ncbi:MAG: hypothetical protein GEU83_16815 [Pseudonocardiaceae bacterium]|nr:hypothetical protein [Pseudonocardiaceae bacterium]
MRGATYRRDGVAVVALAQDSGRPEGMLQLLGDGLAAALGQRVDGARQEVADCVAALRERGWTGDTDLADQLDALAGSAPVPMLRPIPVDLEELAGIIEGDPMDVGGVLDLHTGEVWHQSTIEYVREGGDDIDVPDFDDPERCLWVHGEGSRDGYRDMVQFIDTVADPDRADRLTIAVDGRGAFRRFKDVLARWPGESARWYEFSNERQRGRTRAWLADVGYRIRH